MSRVHPLSRHHCFMDLPRTPLWLALLWGIAFVLLLPSNPVRAQDSDTGSLSANPDTTSAPVGAVVLLNLDYQLPPGGHLPGTIAIEGLEDARIVDTQSGPGRIGLKLILDNTQGLRTGPVRLKYLDEQGGEHWLETGGIRINAVSNLEDNPEERGLKPIRDIIPTQSHWRTRVLWGLGAALICAALAGMIIRYRRRKGASRWQPEQPAPQVRARRSIDDLARAGLFEQGRYKAYYFRFSEILKHYLEDIRGFPAAEYTTEEIAGSITHEEDYVILGLLKQADLVKFADAVPTPARRDEEIAAAFEYIGRTSPGDRPGSVSDGGIQA